MKFIITIFVSLVITSIAFAESPSPKSTWMCSPGELLFSENFEPDTISARWGFKDTFVLRNGALQRTAVNPKESKRVFLKDTSFHNTIIQFDFRFSGETTDLRLVTGSGGGYNSVTQISPDHMQVNTASDQTVGIVPSQLGECRRKPHAEKWQTITVEYWNDEIVAHLSEHEFVVGKHPIVDRTRTYFAFQFDLPGASIDNIRIWKANAQKKDWGATRKKIRASQDSRKPVIRTPTERYKIASMNLRSHLTLNDQNYRDLVNAYSELKSALHADYPQAFITHKQLSKRIAKRKQEIKASNPEFKTMEIAVHRASRAEDVHVESQQPELAALKQDGIPRQRYLSELGQVRARLEAEGDKKLASLVAETAQRQAELEARFPAAFESVDKAVMKRQQVRQLLNSDAKFQTRNRAVVDAGNAVKEYEHKAEPDLGELEAQAKAYQDSQKPMHQK